MGEFVIVWEEEGRDIGQGEEKHLDRVWWNLEDRIDSEYCMYY
jgi:hypothetical protein